MNICLKLISPIGCRNCEYNMIIDACGNAAREIRNNLPESLIGDGIKINCIVRCCGDILEPPCIPCKNLFALSEPIRIVERNNRRDGFEDFYCQDSCLQDSCCEEVRCNREKEYAIIIRSYNPQLSQLLCIYPKIFLEDADETVKLVFLFDKNGSCSPFMGNNNQNGWGCGCGCCDFGLFGLLLLFCLC
ncbi:hypothetical protein JCM1393_01250 [Clostridium carnis]